MKKILLFVLLTVWAGLNLIAQPTLVVGTHTGAQGSPIDVTLTFNGMSATSITGMDAYIQFDPSVITFVSIVDINATYSEASDWLANAVGTTLSLGYITAGGLGNPETYPEGTVICKLRFTPANPGISALDVLAASPITFTPTNFYDFDLNPIEGAVFSDGSVTVTNGATSTTWNGTGLWSVTSNWSAGIPGTTTDAVIASGVVTLDPALPSFAKNLTVSPNAGITIPNNTSLAVAQNLTLNSDVNNNATGSLIIRSIPNPNPNEDVYGVLSVAGTTNYKRWLSGGQHHFIANPLRNTVEVSSLIYAGNPGWLYRYNEPTSAWVNMWGTLEDVSVGYGYAINYTNNQMVTFASTNPDAFNPNATVAPTLTRTGTGIDNGFNLVGNPYPSALDWLGSGWTKTALDNALYFYNGSGYSTWVAGVGSPASTTQYIPAGQGFFVKANASGPRLTIPKASAVHNNQSYYKNEVNNILRVFLTGFGKTDETVVRFSEGATSGFDSEYDAYKLLSLDENMPQIFSNSDVAYAINAQSEIINGTTVDLTIQIKAEGSYTLNAAEISSFNNETALYLEDKELNQVIDLRVNPQYTFNSTEGEHARFKLMFNTSAGINEPGQIASVFASGKNIYLNGAEGEVEVYNLNGQLVAAANLVSGNVNTVNLENAGTGVYMVKVITPAGISVTKVLVK